MSTCDMSGADDEVSEICKQQVTSCSLVEAWYSLEQYIGW